MNLSHSAFPGKPVQQGQAREKALAHGLRIFALQHGREFREPLQCDSNGEFHLAIVNPDNPTGEACGRFGGGMAEIIARHNPRCGISPSNHMSPDNGWCRMNHFDVENLLSEI